MIDFERKIVLVHPPRCGGTSIANALFAPDDYFLRFPWLKHRSMSEYRMIIQSRGEEIGDYKWYGLVRDPVSRLQSMYAREYWLRSVAYPRRFAKLLGAASFARFVALVEPMNHEGKNLSLANYFDDNIEIEVFDISELNELAQRLGIHQLDHLQKSEQAKPRISLLSRAVIHARFRGDFYLLGLPEKSLALRILGHLTMFVYSSFHSLCWRMQTLINAPKPRRLR